MNKPTQKLTSILEIAKDVLQPYKLKGLHVDDISRIAAEKNNNLGLAPEIFSKKLQAALAANLKLKSQRPTFSKVEGKKKGQFKRGWYRLKKDTSRPIVDQIIIPETEKDFIGKAGEFSVMSELLFWGYNASVMTVDSGVDVIASKESKYFHIQVKTATENSGKFSFTIKYNSFLKNHSSNMYYVFVLRRGLRNEYVIIPSTHLQHLISGGRVNQAPTLSITISVDANGKKYLLNSNNVDVFVNNFGGIIIG
jgi:hypothetical protein